MDRRVWLRSVGAFMIAAPVGAEPIDRKERRIEIQLRRYALSVERIDVQSGERITFVLTATDFVHGFSLPQLQARADVAPGHSVELAVGAPPSGRYVFLCDNFCGEGHDRMTGTLTVTAR